MTLLRPQTGAVPHVAPSALSAPFWNGCRRGELLFQRCRACDAANFPPAWICRRCLAPDLEWERSTGRGSLYSWTVVWRPQTPAFAVPYAPAIVELAEGFSMLSNVVGCDAEVLESEMALEVVFHSVDDTLTLPYFRPILEGGPR